MAAFARHFIGVFVAVFLVGSVPPAHGASEKHSPGALDRFLGNQAQYFKLDPFNIPVIRDGRVVNQVTLQITVETLGITDKNKVIAARQKLQSAFLTDLHGVISIRHGDGRPFDAASVKYRLMRRAEQVLGPGIAKNILIEHAFNRRVR